MNSEKEKYSSNWIPKNNNGFTPFAHHIATDSCSLLFNNC
jgi:hypothetical protein